MSSKFCILIIVIVLAYTACKPTHGLSLATPHNRILNGEWIIDSVEADSNFSNDDLSKLVLFDDAPASSFANAQWAINDDGAGWYNINNTTGVKGKRDLSWNILTGKSSHFMAFVRQRAPKGILANHFTTYCIEITEINKTVMKLKYPVNYNNRLGDILITLHKAVPVK